MNSNDIFSYIYAYLRKSGKIGGSVSKESIKFALLAASPGDLGGQIAPNRLKSWASDGVW